jgi:hypothetical protein
LFDIGRWMAHQNLLPVGEAGTSNNTICGKDFGLGNCSGITYSAPRKSFTAAHFEPRIDVKPWFDMMRREIPTRPIRELPNKESEPDPKRPRESPSGALRYDTARHFPHATAVKRQAPEGQPAGYSSSSATSASYRYSSSRSEAAERERFPEPLLPRKRIPYKDKFIVVRLPPPPPPPRKQPDLRPEDGRFGM